MALSDHKITDAAIAEKGVVAAPDQLSGSASAASVTADEILLSNAVLMEFRIACIVAPVSPSAAAPISPAPVAAISASISPL